jgi:transposase
LLMQIPGVGPITSLAFVLTVGDPWRFSHNRDVGAYLGLTPRRSQTGQSDPQLPITKAGNRYLRTLLVQCSHYILGPFGPDSDLRRTGERIASRGGKNAKKRARVAVARRLAVMMLSMWKTGEVYEPLRNSPKEEISVA